MDTIEAVNKAVKRWATTQEQAYENPSLFLGEKEKTVSVEIKAKRAVKMKNLLNAKNELLRFRGNPLAPKPLRIFFAADESAREACNSCWLSSSGAIHPDCGVRIETYFEAEKSLLRYAESLEEPENAIGYEVVPAK
ncbi:MAG: hypothetical protein AAB428_03485 [Patescibacteria group bacterium]